MYRMLPSPKNQACSNISQPPGDDANNNLGASMSDQDRSAWIRQCMELLTNISAAVDRNTKLTDLIANYIMHGHHGATGMTVPSPIAHESEDIMRGHPGAAGERASSSAIQEREDGSNENMSDVKTRRFRACAKSPKYKDPEELHIRVSHISTNRPCCLNIATG